MKVAIIGATGQTGSVIVQALLESTASTFEVVALTRSSSLQKPGILELQEQGVKVVSTDLSGSESVLTEILVGTDVLISTIYGGSVMDEVPLINTSKAAGVKRYLPCFFATVASPKGALLLRDMKEDVLNHIKKIHQPFTVIDVGWWYQVNLPKLPSGHIDYAAMETADGIAGDCNVPFALTDVPAEAIEASIAKIESTAPSPDSVEFITLAQHQYWYTCCIRGDNTSEYATLLGYLNTQELYPHFERRGFKPYVQEVLD
ncbi:related to Isoflavone reductase homolog P3 [Fusarium oxysporum]|uniref:Related to Isoflavone reductase homolog P3 n=1 Tax=Fusarium oxysporum TaxID=5507 RepID=A0A2H3TJR2_FUSOX|nr:related to Isoflavone reductase homolog P3 [Fusarium oxysporum]